MLSDRKKRLEKEIDEINRLISGKEKLPMTLPPKEPSWYSGTWVERTVDHPDFHQWRAYTISMAFAGLTMGGIIGYSDGKELLQEEWKRASHNPLTASQFNTNARKILGQSVFRSSLVYSYRLALYTGLFCGVELGLKHNVFGDRPVVNRTIAGFTIGSIAGYQIRHRTGPTSVLLGSILGSGIGMLSGVLDNGITWIFDSSRENKQQ
ncbi:hypothetical protein SAMD00019534_014060 [Acytostelium subglobosum LB1]|uniref:hypothetical protein n=1 Tax=Acytostelium subglobosum LB1 TaxID=1410327 RepID=UPI000644EA51|nr:hypothetical protein SAMD00019534_014060 [Acytostelium subglobosum LB1]GAM18231.1 hypothetical protein SAMD00019534_014060 [Acytostelium subglobosum LB1]|eukprot:XP_012758827.1 hypothetical protein SAMD00019534_014060 [Acytostelium subglobosum LB1]